MGKGAMSGTSSAVLTISGIVNNALLAAKLVNEVIVEAPYELDKRDKRATMPYWIQPRSEKKAASACASP